MGTDPERVPTIFISIVHPDYNGLRIEQVSARLVRFDLEVADKREGTKHGVGLFYVPPGAIS